MISKKIWAFSLTLLATVQLVNAQTTLPAYSPSHAEIVDRYKKAQVLDSTIRGTVYKTNVQASWSDDGNFFWYRNNLKDSVREYILTEAATGKKTALFDNQRLATALGAALGKPIDPKRLPLANIKLNNKAKQISFESNEKIWVLDLNTYACKDTGKVTRPTGFGRFGQRGGGGGRRSRWQSFDTNRTSPDSNWVAYIENGNVFVKPKKGGEGFQYTSDGTTEKPYGSLAWSPDSKTLVGYHITPFKDSLVYYIATSSPFTMRGQLRSQPYKQPGDPFTTYEMFLFTIADKKTTKVETEIIDFFSAPYLAWRKNDPRYFLYEKVDRGHQRFRIIEVDAQTGKTRAIVDEKTNTFIYESRIFTEYLPETNEILWTSEKDGWRHIYLVNSLTGDIKPVTKGNWIVKDIDSIDTKKKEIWFSASGMNAAEDPYLVHHYRISFDGKKLVSMTPEMGNHSIAYSPDKKYYLDTYSQINQPPVIELRRTADAKKIAEIERADISTYTSMGFKLAEPFSAKGRDGVTDIYGVVFRPTNFDPAKSYPVIENIYAGPQDAFVPKNFMTGGEMQSIAELGFIVVQIDGMGTANRSKAFHDVCWKNLADAGFPDRILWIKALAAKYPYVNAGKVGLYGTSAGGQNSLGGLLFHPEFYKAAASACGCHDNRVDKQWWNEQWMGYPVGKHYDEQSNVTNAGKLQGDLLLIVGEADTNVPPESTYRVADALIKANKSFDFLAVPGMGHSDGGTYGRAKKKDFFVKSLLGVDPPGRNTNELK